MEILPGFFRYFTERRLRSKRGNMLFPNAKRMNLKSSVSLILVLWKIFWMSFGHEFIGKK